jgi:hypothetical protein
MMSALVLAAIGAGLALMSAAQMVQTLRTGRLRARGGRIVKRASHPVMFWLNFAGLAMACLLGIFAVLWAARAGD